MNISAVDLNLFLVFQSVLEEGSTTRAAARLHITQSAVSNALARLRHAIGDPLFVRSGRGLVPTPRAEEMRPAVASAIGHLQSALGQRFDPATSERAFTVACADHHQAADVPRVAAVFARALPRACLRVVSVDYLLSTDGLATGTVDLVLAPEGTDGPGLHAARLFSESAIVVVRSEHPSVRRAVSIDELNALGHIDVHIALGRAGEVNDRVSGALQAMGLHRRIAMVAPSFTTAAMLAASTDHVAMLPEHAARLYTKLLAIRSVRAPLPELEVGCVALWHDRTHADPGSVFFRELVRRTLIERPVTHRARGRTRTARWSV